MVRRVVLVLVAWTMLACGGSPPAPTKPPHVEAGPKLVAIDLFGTRQIAIEQLLATHGAELRAFGEALMRHEPDVQQRTEAILAKLDALGDFADVTPSLAGYPAPGGMAYYLTLDFVDRADASRRMPFVPSPVETYEDPEGLLADWHTYESTILRLTSAGETTSRRDCPAFHCLGDHKHPAVKELGSKFAARAPVHVEELAAILRSDRDAMHRAAAAYLLAYSSDGPWIVAQLLPAFRDGSALVRNNAMRVLSDVAWYHPEVDVPLEPVLEALSYPATTDRNKAAAILAGLLERPGAARLHREVAKSAGATLLAMLRLQQPNNHDFAYRILKAISGQDFGPHNHAAWEAWLLAQQRSQAR